MDLSRSISSPGLFERLLIVASWAKTLLGLACLAFYPLIPNQQVFGRGVYLAPVIVFSVVGATLLAGNREDRRCIHLAALFVVSASAFSSFFIGSVERSVTWFGVPLGSAIYFRFEAFIPLLLWFFARDFPRTFDLSRGRSFVQIVTWAAGIIGSGLFAVNLVALALRLSATIPEGLTTFATPRSGSLYSTLIFASALLTLPFIFWKSKFAHVQERRRVQLFLGGIVAGAAPLVVIVSLEGLIPPFHRFMSQPSIRLASGFLVYPALLFLPISAAYSVLVHHVMDVRIIIRKAAQYILARYTIILVASSPLFGVALYLYAYRSETITGVLSGGRFLSLAGLSAVAWMTLRVRKRILRGLDRRFFRDQYDAITILSKVSGHIQHVRTPAEFTDVLNRELDRAFHPDAISVLLLDSTAASFVCTKNRMRPLDAGSSILKRLSDRSCIEFEYRRGPDNMSDLPLSEREWLVEGALVLLVPFVSSSGQILGILGIGEKKSELPYTTEDKALLGALASSAGSILEQKLDQGWVPLATGSKLLEMTPIHASLCTTCKSVLSSDAPTCVGCGSVTAKAEIPNVLLGKFRFECLIGAGGMGVVYKARDLSLDRDVAIKTLPRVSPEYAMYLRREGRAVAAVTHPNLATIYGVENWRGQPMLVFEFLPGGNLADRIQSKQWMEEQVIDLGLILTGALECIHAAGILHRDIKPSNIAFHDESTPKLLDFGLARMRGTTAEPWSDKSTPRDSVPAATVNPITQQTTGLAGTPEYMCPESFTRRDWEGVDLWALTMVLFEALAGVNPMHRKTLQETIQCVRTGVVPSIRQYRSDCSDPLSDFFRDSFSKDLSLRPSSALAMRERLLKVQSACSFKTFKEVFR